MGCSKENKPKTIPYYYINHHIAVEPGNDWYCVNGEWIWTVRGREEKEINDANKVADMQPYSEMGRQDYGTIRYQGRWTTVWTDSVHGDYISIDGIHYKLKPDWWTTTEKRRNAESQMLKQIPRVSIEEKMAASHGVVGKLLKGDEGWSEAGRPEWLKVPQLPNISLPGGIMRAFQLSAVVLMLFFALIIYLIFVRGKGAEGVTVGQVGVDV